MHVNISFSLSLSFKFNLLEKKVWPVKPNYNNFWGGIFKKKYYSYNLESITFLLCQHFKTQWTYCLFWEGIRIVSQNNFPDSGPTLSHWKLLEELECLCSVVDIYRRTQLTANCTFLGLQVSSWVQRAPNF